MLHPNHAVNWNDLSNLELSGKELSSAFIRNGLKLSDGRISVLSLSDKAASMSAVESNSVRTFPGRVRACCESIRRLASLLAVSDGELVAVFDGPHADVSKAARLLNGYNRLWVRIKISDTDSRLVSLVRSGSVTPKRLKPRRDTLEVERLADRSEILLESIELLKSSKSMSGPFCRARRDVQIAYDADWKLIPEGSRQTVSEVSKEQRKMSGEPKPDSIRCVIRTPEDHQSKELNAFKRKAKGRQKVARMGKAALEALIVIASKSVGAVACRIVEWCSSFIHRNSTKIGGEFGDLFAVEMGLSRESLRLGMGLKRRSELGY